MAYHKIDLELISYKFKRVKDCAEEWGISKRRVQIYCEKACWLGFQPNNKF